MSDVAAALKLQADARARGRAQGRARQRLVEAHRDEYDRYYREEIDGDAIVTGAPGVGTEPGRCED